MKYFQNNYPVITELYDKFVNAEEYSLHPITQYVDRKNKKAVDEAIKMINSRDLLSAEDVLMSTCISYECAGFIFGFTYALNLFRETGTTKIN